MNYVTETTVEKRPSGDHAEIVTRGAGRFCQAVGLGARASRCVLSIKGLERYKPVAVEIKHVHSSRARGRALPTFSGQPQRGQEAPEKVELALRNPQAIFG